MLAEPGPLWHTSPLEMIRTLFVTARPKPVNCNVHTAVTVHSVLLATGPFTKKLPTWYEKSANVVGLCAQQSKYNDPTVPLVAADKSYTLNADVVVAGFVKPANTAKELSPHDAVETTIRIWFVAANPPEVPVSCTLQVFVKVHAVAPASGPWSVKLPTANVYSCWLCGL
jgi:hypothetical protein